jgi:hypothetical protein
MAVNTQAIFGVVQREGMERGFWTRIGTAFQNQDGSRNLRFDYLPPTVPRPSRCGPFAPSRRSSTALLPRPAQSQRVDPLRRGGFRRPAGPHAWGMKTQGQARPRFRHAA